LIGPSWFQPAPFELCRFRQVPSGILFPPSPEGFTQPALLSSSCSSLRSTTTRQPPPHAHARVPFLRFRPLQRSTDVGARMTRRFQPPALSVFTVSHRLDVLLRPHPCQPCFMPTALLGFNRTSSARSSLSTEAGLDAPGFPLQGVLLSHDEHVLACSPLSHPGTGRAIPLKDSALQ